MAKTSLLPAKGHFASFKPTNQLSNQPHPFSGREGEKTENHNHHITRELKINTKYLIIIFARILCARFNFLVIQ